MQGLRSRLAALRHSLRHRARRLGNRLAAQRAGLLTMRGTLAAQPPEQLAIGDSETATALAAGLVRLAGERVELGTRSPWAVTPPTAAWRDALHGFAWLDDALVARKAERARLHGWVHDWLRRHGRGSGPGWEPGLAGQRLMRLATATPVLLREARPQDARLLLRGLRVHLAFLRARHRRADSLRERAEAAAGLVFGALCVQGERRSLTLGQTALGAVAEQIGPDGGVPSREPGLQAWLFVLLATAAHAMVAAGHTPDPRHLAALARLGPGLRALRMGDGGLPRFHGSCALPQGLREGMLDQSFAQAGAAARGTRRDLCMGFQRLSAGRTAVIVDAAPPPKGLPSAGASPLALEVSVGRVRLFGSVGPGSALGGEWAVAARATAAHSAVEIAGASAARLAPDGWAARRLGRPLVDGAKMVECERADDLDGLWLRGEHDGYLARFGLIVARRLHLSRDGCDFRGEDSLTCPTPAARATFDRAAREGGVPFCVRFHLAPQVEAELYLGGRAVRMRLPDGSFWVMRGSGGTLTLEESIWIDGTRRGALPTRQIVLAGKAEGYFGRVTWALNRADGAAEALRETSGRVPA